MENNRFLGESKMLKEWELWENSRLIINFHVVTCVVDKMLLIWMQIFFLLSPSPPLLKLLLVWWENVRNEFMISTVLYVCPYFVFKPGTIFTHQKEGWFLIKIVSLLNLLFKWNCYLLTRSSHYHLQTEWILKYSDWKLNKIE